MKRAAIFAWPVIGAVVLAFEAAVRAVAGAPMTLPEAAWGAVGWLQWMLFAPLVVLLTVRFPYRRAARGRFLLIHSIAPFVISTAHSGLYFTLRKLVTGWVWDPGMPLREAWILRLPAHLALDVLVYSTTVLAAHAVIFLRGSWAREQERLALERRIAQAELDMLKLQLPPEVVHAKLQEIEEAIGGAPELAERRISEFSTFLRQSLAAVNLAHVSGDDDALLAVDEREVDDHDTPRRFSLALRLLVILGIVPVIVFLLHVPGFLPGLATGDPVRWHAVWRNVALSWFYWPVTLLMVWLASRTRRIALLAGAAGAAPPLWDLGFHTLLRGWPAAKAYVLASSRILDFLIFFTIALGALAFHRYRRWREEAVELAELDARLLRTRAHLLRLQLNPHFLFNTLNSVAALLEDDPAAARTMAARLRVLVDRVLTTFDRQEVPLREEVELLGTYVAIENVRFGENLHVDLNVPAEAAGALVPPLLLQPLVENALRHGLHPATGGRVTVTARVTRGELHLEVLDNGKPRGPIREGIGLSNTRARLRQLYRDAFTFEIGRGDTGFRAAITLPLRS